MPSVTFDPGAFKMRYPEFSCASDATLMALFTEGSLLYLDNTDASPVEDIPTRTVLFNYIVAHLAFLSGIGPGAQLASNGIVGRVSSASQGSVSVSVDSAGLPSWWGLSRYGLLYWQATAPFRHMYVFPDFGASAWQR